MNQALYAHMNNKRKMKKKKKGHCCWLKRNQKKLKSVFKSALGKLQGQNQKSIKQSRKKKKP
jgi:hypothetical protein